jgi:acyl dehydratase
MNSRIVSGRRTILEADLHAFACLVGDFSPVHMDEPYARASAFGARVLHGPAVFAIASGLLAQTGMFTGHLAFLGAAFDMVAPVKLGDTLRAEANERSVRTTADGDREIVRYDITAINQDDEPVLAGTWTQLRPHLGPARNGHQDG